MQNTVYTRQCVYNEGYFKNYFGIKKGVYSAVEYF